MKDLNFYEKPGAITPWPSINQLLDPLERFATPSGYVLAPKSLPKLSALMYLSKEEQLDIGEKCLAKLSLKTFSQVEWMGDECVAVGASCEMTALQNILFDQGFELGLENIKGSQNIGAYCLEGNPRGIVLGQEPLQDRILEALWVKPDGGVVKWGKGLAAAGGPCLAPLVWGLSETPAVLIRLVFKASRVPPARIFLHWSFHDRGDLWDHFNLLRAFTSSWERLDLVIPENSKEKGFVLAQISGLEKEMEAFGSLCPLFQSAGFEDKAAHLKAYFCKGNFHFTSAPSVALMQASGKKYKWHHGLSDSAWIISDKPIDLLEKEKPIWKKRLEAFFDD
ncbi:MAG: hypothetical protein H0V82_03625 [Candidatus Protochlamydia sp.]|nr:hypothetical protein [Candidatus Protochlamydia sp.]